MSEEVVCLTCGDRGFPEALNSCLKCGEAAVHTYCMENLPEDLSEDVSWTCESCILTKVGDFSDNPSVVSVGQGFGIGIQETPYTRSQNSKRRRSTSNSASPEMGRKTSNTSTCCMRDCADTIILAKAASQKKAPGCRKRRRR